MYIKYILGSILSIPLLPWMYFSAKNVRRKIPILEEATEANGSIGTGDSNFNLLVLGESTMAGVGVSSQRKGFAGQLSKLLAASLNKKVHWEVKARSGYTASEVTNKLLPKIEMANPDLIVIGLGANDAFRLHSPYKWATAIKDLIQSLKSKFSDTPIVFINLPPIKQFPALPFIIRLTVGNLVTLFGTELSKIVQAQDNSYYNSEEISFNTWGRKYQLSGNPENYFSDGIHPSETTYKLWAKEMLGFIISQRLL